MNEIEIPTSPARRYKAKHSNEQEKEDKDDDSVQVHRGILPSH
jgi:hypothetical protein